MDTSIQIERLIGVNHRQIAIESQVSALNQCVKTCHYVLMEFQRSVLADYVRVYNYVLRHNRWEDVAQSLRSGSLAHRPRSLGRCLQILTQVMVVSRLEREHGLDLLQVQITRDLPRRFWRHVIPLPDPIQCDLVARSATRQPDGSYTVAGACRKETAACHLPDFLASHRSGTKAVADYLADHPGVVKDQPRVERLLAAVQIDPRAAVGQAACWPLGDVIIALQSPLDADVWTLDPDLTSLAAALGLQLYQPAIAT